ncbi:hypothetical protein T484DRAFT_2225069 [Baffinella frigidus]|nr:hypothetical protein T484DRAFT_2225069 [Cryptophyta sp. CCMP2293]
MEGFARGGVNVSWRRGLCEGGGQSRGWMDSALWCVILRIGVCHLVGVQYISAFDHRCVSSRRGACWVQNESSTVLYCTTLMGLQQIASLVAPASGVTCTGVPSS